MSDTNFQPIFDYIDEKVDGLRQELASKADIEKVLKAVGGSAKQSQDHDDKITILEEKTEGIEHWVMEAAEKVEVPYKP